MGNLNDLQNACAQQRTGSNFGHVSEENRNEKSFIALIQTC